MFRVFSRITNGTVSYDQGLSTLDGLSSANKQVLLLRGVIREVVTPPLGILPQLEGKIEKLNEKGILELDDLVMADKEDLREVLGDDYEDVVGETYNQMLPKEEDNYLEEE